MKVLEKVIALTTALAATAVSAPIAFAANDPANPALSVDISKAGFQITDISKLVTGLLNMVMFVAALLVFAYLIWGGITWITSGGDKGKTEEARNKITAAIVGLAVVAASYAIFLLVISFLGVSNPFTGSFTIPKAY
jgi:hypothetical protein